METNRRTSRVALAIVMAGAITGATVTAAVLVDDRQDGIELTVAPGALAQDGDEADSDEPTDGADSDDAANDATAEPAPTDDDADAASDDSDDAVRDSSAEAMEEAAAVDAAWAVECHEDEGYSIDEAELERAQTEAAELSAILTKAGIDHTVRDADTYAWVEWDYGDGIAQSVTNSYYRTLYPLEPISDEELERIREENAGLIAAFDEAGIAYEIIVEADGWEWVEWDYGDPAAEAVAAEYWDDVYPIEPIPEEELERIREENAGLIAVLEEAGIAYEVVSEADGWEWVEWDYNDEAAQEVVDRYYTELYPPEPIPEEELERIREENAGLTAALDAAGVAYTIETDPSGWEWVEYDYEDPAAQDAVDAYYSELYGECWGGDEWVPSEAELESAREEADAMIAALEAGGIGYELVTEDNGYVWVEWDYEDPAAEAVMSEFWEERSAQDWAEISAQLDELAAAFDAAGIEYVREGHEECETIIFDIEDDAALAVVAGVAGN